MSIPFEQAACFSVGRHGEKITHIVLHTMEGTFEGTRSWFKNPESQVSAHYLISKTGEVLQMVHDADKAWHVCSANPFCLGIEHEGYGHELASELPPAQLNASLELTATLCKQYGVPVVNVIGHNDPYLKQYGNNHTDPSKYIIMSLYRQNILERLNDHQK